MPGTNDHLHTNEHVNVPDGPQVGTPEYYERFQRERCPHAETPQASNGSETGGGRSEAPTVLSAADRKQRPLARGVLDYFGDALLEVAYCSFVGNEQHNPGQELHWAKEKSTDHADCILRHLKDRGTLDTDGVRHSAKVAWRALALLQIELEAERGNA